MVSVQATVTPYTAQILKTLMKNAALPQKKPSPSVLFVASGRTGMERRTTHAQSTLTSTTATALVQRSAKQLTWLARLSQSVRSTATERNAIFLALQSAHRRSRTRWRRRPARSTARCPPATTPPVKQAAKLLQPGMTNVQGSASSTRATPTAADQLVRHNV